MPRILVDFDGVCHKYDSPWTGPGVISDGPVDGAIEALKEYAKHFTVAIFSSRSATFAGREAMKEWFIKHSGDLEFVKELEFPTTKPPGILTIDDRCFCFKGIFPTVKQIKDFKPWNKQGMENAG